MRDGRQRCHRRFRSSQRQITNALAKRRGCSCLSTYVFDARDIHANVSDVLTYTHRLHGGYNCRFLLSACYVTISSTDSPSSKETGVCPRKFCKKSNRIVFDSIRFSIQKVQKPFDSIRFQFNIDSISFMIRFDRKRD